VTTFGIVTSLTGTSIKLPPWAFIVLGLVILLWASKRAWEQMRRERDTAVLSTFIAIGEAFDRIAPSGPSDPQAPGVDTWNRLYDEAWWKPALEWLRQTYGQTTEHDFLEEIKPPDDLLTYTHHKRLQLALKRGLQFLRSKEAETHR
jgi:hypothetical protein